MSDLLQSLRQSSQIVHQIVIETASQKVMEETVPASNKKEICPEGKRQREKSTKIGGKTYSITHFSI